MTDAEIGDFARGVYARAAGSHEDRLLLVRTALHAAGEHHFGFESRGGRTVLVRWLQPGERVAPRVCELPDDAAGGGCR